MKTIKYFSMFSGIGGFEHGIEKADTKIQFECVGYSEIDKYARSIYERHYPDHISYGDATEIRTETIPDFEFLVGGFPCQAFSLAGKRRGFDDTRGTLFFEIARVLKDKRPRYFLLENVKGLLSHDKGKTFQTILAVLSDLGYYVQWTVFNSKDFGVPQNRERIFIEGYLGGECGPEVLSVRRDCEEDNDRRQVSSQYYGIRQGRVHKEDEIMNALACSGHNGGGSQLIKLNNKAQAQSVYDVNGVACTLSANGGGQGGKTGLYKINVVGNVSLTNHGDDDVLDVNGISKTLTATGHQPKIIDDNHHQAHIQKVGNVSRTGHHGGDVYSTNGISSTLCATGYKHGMKILEDVEDASSLQIRRLTPRECERLQGFPDDWTRYGKDDELISDTQRYKCCGNAVTTNVITAIIEKMFS